MGVKSQLLYIYTTQRGPCQEVFQYPYRVSLGLLVKLTSFNQLILWQIKRIDLLHLALDFVQLALEVQADLNRTIELATLLL